MHGAETVAAFPKLPDPSDSRSMLVRFIITLLLSPADLWQLIAIASLRSLCSSRHAPAVAGSAARVVRLRLAEAFAAGLRSVKGLSHNHPSLQDVAS